MTTLRIPDAGIALEGSGSSIAPLPAQAFAITLSDSVIEDMIKCVQSGEEIQLSLGNRPVSLFLSSLTVVSHTPRLPSELTVYSSPRLSTTDRNARPLPRQLKPPLSISSSRNHLSRSRKRHGSHKLHRFGKSLPHPISKQVRVKAPLGQEIYLHPRHLLSWIRT